MNVYETHENLAKPNYEVLLTGRTLLVRPLAPEDITSKYISWLNNPETNRFLEVRKNTQTRATVISYINHIRLNPNLEFFGVFWKSDGQHIGNITLTKLDLESGVSTYGLMIGDAGARIKGAGGEATLLIVNFIFNFCKARAIVVGVDVRNLDAAKLLIRAGFEPGDPTRTQSPDSLVQSFQLTLDSWQNRELEFWPITKWFRIEHVASII